MTVHLSSAVSAGRVCVYYMFYIILQYKSINGEHVLAYPLLSSVMTFGDLG